MQITHTILDKDYNPVKDIELSELDKKHINFLEESVKNGTRLSYDGEMYWLADIEHWVRINKR